VRASVPDEPSRRAVPAAARPKPAPAKPARPAAPKPAGADDPVVW